jgi:hypothetical protein
MKTSPIKTSYILLLFAAFIYSQEIKADVEYRGETTLQSTSYGISFLLPLGWSGIYPSNSDFFIMKSSLFEGYIFVMADQMTVDEAKQIMNQPIDLGDGIIFHPKDKVHIQKSNLEAEYNVSGSQNPLKGLIKTIVGPYKWGISFIAASAPDNSSTLQMTLSKIVSSLKFTDPQPHKSNRSIDQNNPWFEQLNGRKLSHFYTATGYTEEDYIWLCASGYFYKSFNSGGFGGGASGAFQSKNGGHWSVSGSLQQGILLLTYNDGRTARYTLTQEGTKLFLDGKRYFRENANCQ